MTNKKLTIITVSLLSFILVATFAVIRQHAQETSQSQQDRATVIEEGRISEKQKIHSKFYKQPDKGRSLIGKTNKDLTIIIGEPFVSRESEEDELLTTEGYFQRLTCNSDAVVVGKVTNKNSQLSEDKKSVFTDYEFVIEKVIKDSSPLKLQNTNAITVTRSGGVVLLNNQLVRVFDKSYKLLEIGNKYLLFLDFIKESDSFKASDVRGTFDIDGEILNQSLNISHRFSNENSKPISLIDYETNLKQECTK